DERLGERLLGRLLSPGGPRYDSILIDEAHTFEPCWFRCCVAALKDPDNGNLAIVADANQKLYTRRVFTWKSVGVNVASSRTVSKRWHLDRNYRNTKEVLASAACVLEGGPEDPEAAFPSVPPTTALRTGPRPLLLRTADPIEAACRLVEARCRDWGDRP